MPIIEWVTSAWPWRVITVCGQDKSQWFFLNWLFSWPYRHFCWSIFWVKNYGPALTYMGFPGGSAEKESTFSAADLGDVGLIAGLGRSSREGNGNPLQYSCLENSMDRGAWYTIVYGVAESGTTEWLSIQRALSIGNLCPLLVRFIYIQIYIIQLEYIYYWNTYTIENYSP